MQSVERRSDQKILIFTQIQSDAPIVNPGSLVIRGQFSLGELLSLLKGAGNLHRGANKPSDRQEACKH